MKERIFQTELWLPLSPDKLFPFFADASNLQALTPRWLDFQIVTPPPIEMKPGALIDYRLCVHGLPLRWRTRINVWEPPYRFVDEQIYGPYLQWLHEHTFEARDGGTLTRDLVHYAVPLDYISHRWLVLPDIRRIFHFRAEALQKLFPPVST